MIQRLRGLLKRARELDKLAALALLLSLYNTWYTQLRAPSRALRAAAIHTDLRPGTSGEQRMITARIAIVNQGEVPETVLSEAITFGRDGPSMTFGGSVIPTAAGNVLPVPAREARILDVSMAFNPDMLFKWRHIPAIFDGLKAYFGVSLFVLDPKGNQIQTYLRLGSIWFKEDGTIAQTDGTRATASLLGDAPSSMTWHSSDSS